MPHPDPHPPARRRRKHVNWPLTIVVLLSAFLLLLAATQLAAIYLDTPYALYERVPTVILSSMTFGMLLYRALYGLNDRK